MPRPERGKTKTNQAISMRLYLDDDFQKRKEILSQQSRNGESVRFYFPEPLLFGAGSGRRFIAEHECATIVFDDDPGRKPRRDSRRPMSQGGDT
jgi:hypothetical protein